jgi:hypothetical protein
MHRCLGLFMAVGRGLGLVFQRGHRRAQDHWSFSHHGLRVATLNLRTAAQAVVKQAQGL